MRAATHIVAIRQIRNPLETHETLALKNLRVLFKKILNRIFKYLSLSLFFLFLFLEDVFKAIFLLLMSLISVRFC